MSIDELRERADVRPDLVFALKHISRRKNGFEDAGASLFRLALAENESWANNATSVWSSLFLAALNLTHRDFGPRLAILRQRVMTGTVDSRLVALKGLASAVSREHAGPGYSSDDTLDGPWTTPTIGQVVQAKLNSWELLKEPLVDTEPAVAEQARKVAIANLQAAIRWGAGVSAVNVIADTLSTWGERELARLRKELDSIKAYHAGQLEEDSKLGVAVARLSALIAPETFHDRLVDLVGRWFPGDQNLPAEKCQDLEDRLDKELAAEGLSPPTPLLAELEWLDTEEAVRSVPFMVHVGAVDQQRLLLEPLLERVKAGGSVNTLSAYLIGVARSESEDEVDELLRKWRDDSRLALITLLTVRRLGATDERIEWIAEDLENGHLDPQATNCLTMGSWGRGGSGAAMRKLIETLAKSEAPVAQLTALDLILDRAETCPPEVGTLEPTLLAVVRGLASQRLTETASCVWERGCKLLLTRGHTEAAVDAAVVLIKSTEQYGSDKEAWKVLLEAAPEIVWRALALIIEPRDTDWYRVVLEAETHKLVSHIPPEVIMEWVGEDKGRSLIVALLCPAHEHPLNELARQLIIRFGPNSPAAWELAARAHSTPGVVSSMSGFAKTQLEHAQAWAEDPDTQVAEWGKARLQEFQKSSEAESAREEFEERQGM